MKKLSDRVHAGSEAAPWVIEEIKALEAELEKLRKNTMTERAKAYIYCPCGEVLDNDGRCPLEDDDNG